MSLKPLLHISLFFIAFVILYHDTLAHIVRSWSVSEGSASPLILVVSLYLVWRKRKDFKEISKRPALLPGTLLILLGCFMLFSGKLSSTMLVQQISIIPTLLGAIGLFWGLAYLNALLIPVGYLIFLTGFVEELLWSASIYLQIVAAWIAAQMLTLFGMRVFLNGIIIELPHVALEVARGCSGINHIVALIALAVPLASMTQETPLRKCVLPLAAFFIGIFANGLRIAFIGVYTSYFADGPLHGPYETLYVSFIFFVGMVALILLSQAMSKSDSKLPSQGPETTNVPLAGSGEMALGCQATEGIRPFAKRFAPIIIALALFSATLGCTHFYNVSPVQLKSPLEAFPTQIGDFAGKPLDSIHEQFRPFPADQELLRVYENPSGKKLDLYIGYLEMQDRERKLIDYRRDWKHEEAKKVAVGHASKPIMINKTTLRDRANPADVYFWYVMDGRIITNRYAGKFLTFWDGLMTRNNNAAVIVIQTQNQEAEVMPFLKDLVPMVNAYLSGD